MQGPGKPPARTEADLRAAFAELGRHAPSAEDVLSAVREARSHRRWNLPQPPGGPWLAVSAITVAAAIVVALPLLLSGSPGRTGGPQVLPALPNPPASAGVPPDVISPGRHPSSASLAKAMLTAFSASADRFAYWTVAGFSSGHLTQLDQSWLWPAVPSPGQVQYIRDADSMIPPGVPEATGSVKLTDDNGYTTIVPHPSRYQQKEQARLIVVCYAGTGQTGCANSPAGGNTPAGTWSTHTGVMPYIDYTPNPSGADLARQIARGEWRIAGHTRLRGQPVIKLAATRNGQFQQRPVYLWVSTITSLPLRMAQGPAKFFQLENWYYLPPTKANLGHLRVPIPPHYPRSG